MGTGTTLEQARHAGCSGRLLDRNVHLVIRSHNRFPVAPPSGCNGPTQGFRCRWKLEKVVPNGSSFSSVKHKRNITLRKGAKKSEWFCCMPLVVFSFPLLPPMPPPPTGRPGRGCTRRPGRGTAWTIGGPSTSPASTGPPSSAPPWAPRTQGPYHREGGNTTLVV